MSTNKFNEFVLERRDRIDHSLFVDKAKSNISKHHLKI